MMESLPLLNEDNASELDCHVVADVEIGGERFVLLSPKKTWVSLVRDDADGVVELSPEEFAPLAEAFAAELAPKNLKLEVQSGEYLLDGHVTDEISESCDAIHISDDDDDESYLILADVEKDDAQYLLLVPDTPAMFAAKVKDGKARALNERELERVETELERALEARTH